MQEDVIVEVLPSDVQGPADRLDASINDFERSVNNLGMYYRNAKTHNETLTALRKRAMFSMRKDESLPEIAREEYTIWHRTRLSQLSRAIRMDRNYIDSFNDHCDRLLDTITELNDKVIRLKKKYAPRVYSLNDIIERLKDNPIVDESTIHINTRAIEGEDALVFEIPEGLQIHADRPQTWPTTFGLPARMMRARIKIYLKSFGIRISTVMGMGYSPSGHSGQRVHPHILSGNNPCLGDFETPLYEMWNDGDVNGMVDIIQLFLEQSALGDAAGKHWNKWWLSGHAEAFKENMVFLGDLPERRSTNFSNYFRGHQHRLARYMVESYASTTRDILGPRGGDKGRGKIMYFQMRTDGFTCTAIPTVDKEGKPTLLVFDADRTFNVTDEWFLDNHGVTIGPR